MKKILSLILTVATAVSLAACSLSPAATTAQSSTTVTTATTEDPKNPSAATKETAKNSLAEAIDKFYENDSMHVKTTLNLTISSNGLSMESVMSKDFYGACLSTSPVWRSVASQTVMGQEETNETYFADGEYYISKYGFNGRVSRSEEADEAFGWKKTFEVFLEKLPSDICVTYFKVNEDGSCEIKADTAKNEVMFDEYLEGLEESFAESEEEGVTVSSDSPAETVHIIIGADGNITEYNANIELPLTMSAEGESEVFVVTAEIKTTLENVNGNVTVREPDTALTDFVHTTTEKFEYTYFQEAYQKFIKKPDIAGSLYGYIAVDIGGITTEMEMSGTIHAKDYKGETPIVRQRTHMTMGSNRQTTDIYFANGYYYIGIQNRTVSDAESQKLKLTEEEYAELYGESADEELFTLIGDSSFKSVDVDYDGTTANIYFDMKENIFSLLFAEEINSVQQIIVGENEIVSSKVVYAVVIAGIDAESGELIGYATAFDLEIQFKMNGKVYTAYASAYDGTEIEATENVTVPAPANLDSYSPPQA